MKLAVVGSRGFNDYDILSNEIGKLKPTKIISGGAKGADQLAEKYAKEKGLETIIFLPEYNLYGRTAPLKRNIKIIEACDRVLAFWDGKSRGTAYTIKQAETKGKKTDVILI